MTLQEMSVEYRQQGLVLRGRIQELRQEMTELEEGERRDALHRRVEVLHRLWLENRELSVLLERYYERGYHRNERYTL